MKNALLLIWIAVLTLSVSSCSKTKKLARQHHELEDTYQTLKREMSEAEVTLEGEKVKVVLPEAVLFNVNSADLNTEYLPILGRMATILNKYDKTSVLITGFTDVTGTENYNLELSKKRAESAKAVLVKNKVNSGRIFTWGLGDKNPVADNSTLSGRKQNRRVEYVILYDYKPEKE
ncbi:OmpA family protein [Taibaiella helva]|uniref:OmpA family protein n=1 Tax=Taibaiella helva TaxID=2301235 RepID=UPI000E596226|nr:OmpA family protein [Taibaiella helva]